MNATDFRTAIFYRARRLCNRAKPANAVEPAIADLQQNLAEVHLTQTPSYLPSQLWSEVAVIVHLLNFGINREYLEPVQNFLHSMSDHHGSELTEVLSDNSEYTTAQVLDRIEALHDQAVELEQVERLQAGQKTLLQAGQEDSVQAEQHRDFLQTEHETIQQEELTTFEEVYFLGTVTARQIPAHLAEKGRSLPNQDHYDLVIQPDGLYFECPVPCKGSDKGVLFRKTFDLIAHIIRFHAPPTAEYADLKPVRVIAVNMQKRQYRLNLPGGRYLDWRLAPKVPGTYTDFF